MTEAFDLVGKRVWVTGHTGMVGSALVRRIADEQCDILTVSSQDLDLTRQQAVEDWVAANRPDVVIMAAAKVGGIVANRDYPADFAYINQTIQTNVIQACHLAEVEKLVFLGSACMYPRGAAQPLTETDLMTGPLEPTNEAYGMAKLAGMQLCQAIRQQYGRDYITLLPTNSYGPGDNYDLETSHVPAALMVKCHQAVVRGQAHIDVWGSGKPTRDFLHVDDMADGIVFATKHYSSAEPMNLGSGQETSILELARAIAAAVGFGGDFRFDASKPDGAPRKLLNPSKLAAMGWQPGHSLASGMKHAYSWYRDHVQHGGG